MYIYIYIYTHTDAEQSADVLDQQGSGSRKRKSYTYVTSSYTYVTSSYTQMRSKALTFWTNKEAGGAFRSWRAFVLKCGVKAKVPLLMATHACINGDTCLY